MGWIVLALIVAAVLFAISIYNRLIAGRNRFKNAFAQIDVQLTRRHDLIPNLVETAKGYIKHERETLDAEARAFAEAFAPRLFRPDALMTWRRWRAGGAKTIIVSASAPTIAAGRPRSS